jgi:prepilin-type N-terminal cleavage/methylation domain-containing protein
MLKKDSVKNNKGFTIVEIMIVISIITVLISVFFLISWHRTRSMQEKVKDVENMRNQSSSTAFEDLSADKQLIHYQNVLDASKFKKYAAKADEPVVYRISKGVVYEGADEKNTDSIAKKLLVKAFLKAKSGDLEEALKLLKEASVLNPVDAEVYTDLARVIANRGDIDQALEQVNSAIRFEPKYADAYIVRARLMLEKGNLKGAEKDLEHASKLTQSNAEIFLVWSEYYMKKGNEELAKDYLQKFRVLNN